MIDTGLAFAFYLKHKLCCFCCLLFTIVLLISRNGRAEHTLENPITEQTAYTKHQGRHKVGLWTLEAAHNNSLTFGCTWATYFLLAPNAHVKWQIVRSDPVAIGVRASVLTFRGENSSSQGQSSKIRLFVGSLEPMFSWRVNTYWTLSTGNVLTLVTADGDISTASFNGVAAAAVSNVQYLLSSEWRINRTVALVVTGRYLLFQKAQANANISYQPDAFTRMTLHGAATTSSLDYRGAGSIVGSVHWSWRHIDLRIGVGYGNWSLPLVNFVVEKKTLIPDLDFAYYF